MSEFLQDVKEEKTRIYYIKRAQHVLKKLGEALDNYKYFVSHFDNVINFDNIADSKKQEYKHKYLDISTDANKIVKSKNKPIIKKEIKNAKNTIYY